MPPKGWKTLSVRESLYKALKKLGEELNPPRSVAGAIDFLLRQESSEESQRL